jgi:hypothetical protein
MLVNTRYYFLCAAILFAGLFSTATSAADRGLYRCKGDCVTPKPFEANESAVFSDRLFGWIVFIKSDVNAALNVGAWGTFDTVQICNGEICMTFVYNTGNWYTVNAVPDTGQQTRADSVKRTKKSSLGDTGCNGGGSNGRYYVADGSGGYLLGYYQWWDYYTNNIYEYSSQREFVPTGYAPGPGVPWSQRPGGGGLRNCS